VAASAAGISTGALRKAAHTLSRTCAAGSSSKKGKLMPLGQSIPSSVQSASATGGAVPRSPAEAPETSAEEWFAALTPAERHALGVQLQAHRLMQYAHYQLQHARSRAAARSAQRSHESLQPAVGSSAGRRAAGRAGTREDSSRALPLTARF
jgi:hypothetical protein